MIKKEIIAMILAGGQGSRLHDLTIKTAKPAVPYGGKYRIIDFTLSNCSNSGIYTVGILTQYQPLELNSHVEIGEPWDLDRNNGGVKILPPYTNQDGLKYYLGTANAIFENMTFMDNYNPDYVLILSGDHIYKMDYAKMLGHHKKNNADVTISVIEVPWKETSRFGILNLDKNNKVYEFDEKPKNAKSNTASMGVYIFNYAVLKKYLLEDSKNENSDHDFGKNIIPSVLKDGLNLYAYRFDGYWKDVGTVKSLWEANMDLLKADVTLDLYDDEWKIYTKNFNLPPHYIGPDAMVESALLNEGCVIHGTIKNSVIFTEVEVDQNVEIINSVILPGVKIRKGSRVYNTIVMENVEICENEVIGNLESDEITLVGRDVITCV